MAPGRRPAGCCAPALRPGAAPRGDAVVSLVDHRHWHPRVPAPAPAGSSAVPAGRVGWHAMGWWLFLLAMASSFLVMVEPAPTDLLFVAALGALVLGGVRPGRVVDPVATVGAALFLWFTLLSMMFVVERPVVAIRAAGIEVYMVLLWLVTAYWVRHDGDRAFGAIMACLLGGALAASAIGALALLDLVPNREVFYRDEYLTRIKSTFKDPNVLGPYLVPPLLLSVWLAFGSGRLRLRLFAALCAAFLGTMLVVTFSRGAWAHGLLSLGLFGLVLLVHGRTRMPVLLTGMAALTGLAAVAAAAAVLAAGGGTEAALPGPDPDSYLASRLSLQSYDQSRFAFIIDALGRILDRPLGIGPNQVLYVYGYEPHNTFVVLAVNNGILSALGFALLYGAAVWRCVRKTAQGRPGWMKFAFLASVLIGIFPLMNVVGALHWRHLFVVMGLAYGTYRSNAIFPASPRPPERAPARLPARAPARGDVRLA